MSGDGNALTGTSVLLPFWPYFLLAALFLLLVEWFIRPRMARFRQPVELRHKQAV
jgi:hypothetical protein